MAIGEYFSTVIGILQLAVFIMLIREIFGIGYASQSSPGGMGSANTMGGSPGGNEKTWLDSAQEMASNGVEKAQNQIADDEEFLEQEFPKHFDDEVASILDDQDRAESAVEELSDLSDELEKELGAYRSAHPKTAARRTNLAAVLTGIQQAVFDSVGEGQGLNAMVQDLDRDVRKSRIDVDKLRELLMKEEEDVDKLEEKEKARASLDEAWIKNIEKSKKGLEEVLQVVKEDENRDIDTFLDSWRGHITGSLDGLAQRGIHWDYHGLDNLDDLESMDELQDALEQMIEHLGRRLKHLEEDIEDAQDTSQGADKTQEVLGGAQEQLKTIDKLNKRIADSKEIILATVTGGETEDGSTKTGIIDYTKSFDIKGKTKALRNAEEDPETIVEEIGEFNAGLARDIHTVEIALNRLREDVDLRENNLQQIESLLNSQELQYHEIDV